MQGHRLLRHATLAPESTKQKSIHTPGKSERNWCDISYKDCFPRMFDSDRQNELKRRAYAQVHLEARGQRARDI